MFVTGGIELKAPEKTGALQSFATPDAVRWQATVRLPRWVLSDSLEAMRGLLLSIVLSSVVTDCMTLAGEVGSNPPGLSVRRGMLTLVDMPFRGIGVNYFSMFSRLLNDPKDDSSLTNLIALGKANIPFVRFMCGGYWPAEQRF